MAKVLVIEDDEQIGRLLADGLRANGHDVSWCRSGRDGLVSAASTGVDLVLLDLGLPDLDGVEVCRRLRQMAPQVLIMMLTARESEMDIVVGLDAGADDYLVKPFRFSELLARLRALLRRVAGPAGQPVAEIGSLVVDERSRVCTLGGVIVPLRHKEFDLLARLAAEPGVAVRRETLMDDVWDENWFGSTKTLDVHIAAVRRKIDEVSRAAGVTPPSLTTVRGHGYRLGEGIPS